MFLSSTKIYLKLIKKDTTQNKNIKIVALEFVVHFHLGKYFLEKFY
jgi:hypothetical protein